MGAWRAEPCVFTDHPPGGAKQKSIVRFARNLGALCMEGQEEQGRNRKENRRPYCRRKPPTKKLRPKINTSTKTTPPGLNVKREYRIQNQDQIWCINNEQNEDSRPKDKTKYQYVQTPKPFPPTPNPYRYKIHMPIPKTRRDIMPLPRPSRIPLTKKPRPTTIAEPITNHLDHNGKAKHQ